MKWTIHRTRVDQAMDVIMCSYFLTLCPTLAISHTHTNYITNLLSLMKTLEQYMKIPSPVNTSLDKVLRSGLRYTVQALLFFSYEDMKH